MVQAAVVVKPDAEVEITDIVLPEPTAGQVRVRIAAAGVCHSDLSMINGTLRPSFPLVLGHEASGTVTAVGEGVIRVSPGDRVVVNWAAPCRRCWFCLHGEPHLCKSVEGVASLPGGALADGTPLNLTMGVGAFADAVVLPTTAVVPLPDGVPLDVAALLGCAVLTGVGAVRNTARVRPGESVVVIGLGGIGLSAITGARLAGAGPIIAVDLTEEKENLAMAAGATHFVRAGDKQGKQIRALTAGRGTDHAFECVGRAATIRAAWGCTRRGGQVTVVGVGRQDDQFTLNALEIYHFARTIAVSVYGSGDADRDIPWLAEQITLGRLDLEPLVSHRIGLAEVGAAFQRMRAGVGARSLVILDPTAR